MKEEGDRGRVNSGGYGVLVLKVVELVLQLKVKIYQIFQARVGNPHWGEDMTY